jgi:hypothetical protein
MVYTPKSDVDSFGWFPKVMVAKQLAKFLCLMFGLVLLLLTSPLQVSNAEASGTGYWITETLYGVEISRTYGDGPGIGFPMAAGYYSATLPQAPSPHCYLEFKMVRS